MKCRCEHCSYEFDAQPEGGHRVLVGDSTDAASVARLMQSETATLVFTSPPYGAQRYYTTGGVGDWDVLMEGVFAILPVTEATQILVNLALVPRESEWQPYWQTWLEWIAQAWLAALWVVRLGPGRGIDGRLEWEASASL